MPNAVIIAQQTAEQERKIDVLQQAVKELSLASKAIAAANTVENENPTPSVFYGEASDYRYRMTNGNDPHRFNITCDYKLGLRMALTDKQLETLMRTSDATLFDTEFDSVGKCLNGRHIKVVFEPSYDIYLPIVFVQPVLCYVDSDYGDEVATPVKDSFGRTLYKDEPVFVRGLPADRIGMIVSTNCDGDGDVTVKFSNSDGGDGYYSVSSLIRADL